MAKISPPWSLRSCKNDEEIRQRCRDMFLGDLRELQTLLEIASENLLYSDDNRAAFKHNLGIVTPILEERESQNYNE